MIEAVMRSVRPFENDCAYFPSYNLSVYEFSASRLMFVYETYFLVCEDVIPPAGEAGAPACSQVGPNAIPCALYYELAVRTLSHTHIHIHSAYV